MRWCYTAVVLSAVMISSTAKAGNMPDPKTVADLATVLLDLTAQNVPKAVMDLNQTELDWLIYRAAHPDSPHTPVIQDTLFINTALALGYLANQTAAGDLGSATQATLKAQTYVLGGPPPYTKPSLSEVEKVCRAIVKSYK
jgi:hypothetical protein